MPYIYCIMNSGKPLTPIVRDVLLFNAYDMFQEGNEQQAIKSRQYSGIIKSNLEVTEYAGVPVVSFEATISTAQWEANEVLFAVRVDELDGIEQGEWVQLGIKTMMFDDLPPEIQEKFKTDGPSPFSRN